MRPPIQISRDPAKYVVKDPGLRAAIDVSLLLGLPLLLTGEPGTGKSSLAAHLAYVFDLGEPLVFNAKTTSTASDLFYRYDALRRFQDGEAARKVEDYVTYQALGKAVLAAMPLNDPHPLRPKEYLGSEPTRSIVLIDEIDKAPRDFPNDILNEIDRMEFSVPELESQFDPGVPRKPFQAEKDQRPIVVLTSNSERDLPDAFLRRCAYYHIPFPSAPILQDILEAHGIARALTEAMIARFLAVRSLQLVKKPGTAELLAWGLALQHCGFNADQIRAEANEIGRFDPVVVKTQPDVEALAAADLKNRSEEMLAKVKEEIAATEKTE